LSNLGYYIYGFFNQRFLIEYFYNKFIVNVILNLGGQTIKVLDKGSIELLGPYGLEKGLFKLSKVLNNLNLSIVSNYALYITIGFMSYIIMLFYINIIFSVMLIILLTITLIYNK
jgi:NADH-ubiquinone oxidoreductase chain 5